MKCESVHSFIMYLRLKAVNLNSLQKVSIKTWQCNTVMYIRKKAYFFVLPSAMVIRIYFLVLFLYILHTTKKLILIW